MPSPASGSAAGELHGGDSNVAAARILRSKSGFRQAHAVTDFSELDQHRQVHAGDDLGLHLIDDRNGEVRGRAAEHVGQNHHAVATVNRAHGVDDVGPTLFHVVI